MTAHRPHPTGLTRLLVVAKEPIPGRVKTRLTPPYSPGEAADLAAAAIADTLDVASRVPGTELIVVLDGQPGPWLPAGVRTVPQRQGPFDERLAGAFDDVADAAALLIGMDTPQVTEHLLRRAVDALRDTDAVFGPALDGGWWALGLRRPDGDLLRGVVTSTARTGADQRARLLAAGLAVARLPVLRDVDTAQDAEAVAAQAPGTRFARTIAGLRRAA